MVSQPNILSIAVTRRNSLREAVLAVFFLLSFSILKFFPMLAILSEGWIAVIFFFLITSYVGERVVKGMRITKFEGYILLLLVWAPVSSAIQSRSVFGQPLIYGLLAQRNIMLAVSAIFLLYLLRRNRFTLHDIEHALVKLAWACLAIFTLITLVFDPSQFADAGKGFVGGGNVGEASFKFNTAFVVFGFFYYMFNGFWRRNTRQVLLAMPFLLYLILVEGGRSLLLSVFGSLVFFVYRWSSFGRIIRMTPKLLFVSLLLFAALLLFKQDYLVHLGMKFGDAITVVLTGEKTADASANARISETLIALPYIVKHWAFGNGDLSNQWKGGYASHLGYFYPADIGIIGAVFLYGIFGVLLFSIQFLFAVRYASRLPKHGAEYGEIVSAAKCFLLYYAIHSLVTGRFVHSAETGLLFIAILYWTGVVATSENANDRSGIINEEVL